MIFKFLTISSDVGNCLAALVLTLDGLVLGGSALLHNLALNILTHVGMDFTNGSLGAGPLRLVIDLVDPFVMVMRVSPAASIADFHLGTETHNVRLVASYLHTQWLI